MSTHAAPSAEQMENATSPRGNLDLEARLQRPETARDRFMQKLSAEGGEAPSDDVEREAAEAAAEVLGAGDGDPEQEAPETNQADAREEGAEGAETTAGDGDDGDAGDGALNPTKLAEMAGITPDQLYEMELVTGDGESFTLGEIKDRVQDLSRLDERTAEIEQDAIEGARTIAEQSANLTTALEQAQRQQNFVAELAESAVRQFDGVNWDLLRSEPEKYQAMQTRFQQAVQNRDRLKAAAEQLEQRAAQERQAAQDRQAQVSISILKRTIRGWDNEVYGKVMDYAVEHLRFTPEEAADVRDWRTIMGWHRLMQADAAAKRVRSKEKRRDPAPPGSRRARQPQPRNAQGQYQSAKREAQARPGDRAAFREMKAAQLRAERGG